MSRYIDADVARRIIDSPRSKEQMLLVLSQAEPADVVEVVHGEWHPRTDLPKQEIFICSVCGGWAYSPWIGNRKNPKPNWCKYKYCPNCGADMRGGRNERSITI